MNDRRIYKNKNETKCRDSKHDHFNMHNKVEGATELYKTHKGNN